MEDDTVCQTILKEVQLIDKSGTFISKKVHSVSKDSSNIALYHRAESRKMASTNLENKINKLK